MNIKVKELETINEELKNKNKKISELENKY